MLFEIEGTGFDKLFLLSVNIGGEEKGLDGDIELDVKGHCIVDDGKHGITFVASDVTEFKGLVNDCCGCIMELLFKACIDLLKNKKLLVDIKNREFIMNIKKNNLFVICINQLN
jgi:hypothetical protein